MLRPIESSSEHLARHRLADLFLDTLPYNAHTTASDALWAGLPVVTHIGNSFAGRVAASLLSAVGLPELITRTRADYEALAIELALDKQKLADIRRRLQGSHLTASLFDAALYAKRLETAFEAMYQRYQTAWRRIISTGASAHHPFRRLARRQECVTTSTSLGGRARDRSAF